MGELNANARTDLTERIRAGRKHLLDQISGLADEALGRRPEEGEWSVVEVLAHLPDVDRHWLEQALLIRDNPDHIFVHFDDERWKRNHPAVRQIPLDVILRAMQGTHEAVLETLLRMTESDLARTARHPRGIPYTVRDVFLRYPAHDRNHAEQITAIRRRLGA